MIRLAFAALLLGLAAAAPAPPHTPARPRPSWAAGIADQFATLAFDANPATDTPARDVLGRWDGPMRLFVFAADPEQRETARVAGALSRAAHLPIQLVGAKQVLSLPPNSFVVLDNNLEAAFRGPLRPMLTNAFLDNAAAVDDFISGVIAVQPCWTLPVWTDASRVELKAAVIGIDTSQRRPAVQRCLLQQIAASMGLMGPGGSLRGSVFNAQAPGYWLSHDDAMMLRLLYGPTLHPGMTRQQTTDAILAALRPKHRK